MATFFGTVRLKDQHGLKTTKTAEIVVNEVIHATTALQVMAAYAELAQFAGKLDNVSDLKVEDAWLNVSVLADVAGLKAFPGEQSSAEGAIVILAIEGTDTRHAYWIPGATNEIFMNDFRTIDTADATLQDFFEEFDDPIGDLGVKIVVSDGQDIDTGQGVNGLMSGYYATKQKSGKV